MWTTTRGHDAIAARFTDAIAAGRLATTFLFVGPAGVGKRTFARDLAKSLLCLEVPATTAPPCGRCDACRQFATGNHPDFHWVVRRPDRQHLTIDLFLGRRDTRDAVDGLCHQIALRPSLGSHRVAVIAEADLLTVEAANCLLKTLEEPPPHSVILLIGTSAAKQLPTIRSRAQITRFGPIPVDEMCRLILEQGLAQDVSSAREIAIASDGSMVRAAQLADVDCQQFRQHLFDWLRSSSLDPVRMAWNVEEFVNAAGKEAGVRRERMRQVLGFACDFFRGELRQSVGVSTAADEVLAAALNTTVGEQQRALERLDHTFDAAAHVDRNANQSTLIAYWTECLARS